MIYNKKFFIIKIVTILSIIFFMLHINNTVSFAATNASKTIEDGIYIIKSALNEMLVLDITCSSKEDGGNLELWTNGQTNNQKFRVTYLGDGYYSISPVHSSKLIDVAGNSKEEGANVLQWQSHGGDNQKWIIKDAGNGYYNIVSKSNGLYLDVPQSKSFDGANIQVWTENGANNQKFKFEKQTDVPQGEKTIENGTYYIKTASNENNILDVGQSSLADGANIGVWQKGPTVNQQFTIKYLDNGYYALLIEHSGKYMDLSGSSKTDGANVLQWEYHGGNNQQWVIKEAGDGYYYFISKCNGMYLTVKDSNIETCKADNSNNQKFKFEKVTAVAKGEKTIEDGIYTITTGLNSNYVFDIPHSSQQNNEKLELWTNGLTANQKYEVKYDGNGYYTITVQHSKKAIEVPSASKRIGTKVSQYTTNSSDAQKWVIKEAGDGYYYIIAKNSGLYMEVEGREAKAGASIYMQNYSNTSAQKFRFCDPNTLINIDEAKYPGYKEALEKLKIAHPNWNFEFLYTGIKFSDAVAGEAKVHSRNLVETSYSGEWICSICGTKLYDSGWYCASEKAIAYYLDPRNFLDDVNIFQFQDVNSYLEDACSIDGIKQKVQGSFLQNYAEDINTACKNTNTNPYYIIARLFQEQGTKGTTIGKGMDGGDGKTYYNPFNIGASGNGYTEIYNNALARAKKEGWDTMEKAIEGGIHFCKINWLDNYQNTLYQNRFDIDTRNGTNLYEHQYMQNLLGAYSEARTLRSMYYNTGKLEANFTFIIPVYEQMDKTISQLPSNSSEMYPINVKTTGTNINLRESPNTDSKILRQIENKDTVLLSIERGINSNWQKVITNDGLIGYISGQYLQQIDDVKTCNYTAKVKTNDGDGCNVRVGPGTSAPKLTALADGAEVTVIDNSTYKNINGFDWYRIVLADGRQAFMPKDYLK